MKQIFISDHGRQRIKERLNTSERKMQKLVEKAWNSKEPGTAKENWNEYKTQRIYQNENRVCKKLMGYTFLFAVNSDSIVLVTVL